EYRQLVWQAQMLRRQVEGNYDFEGLVGQSRAMREVFELLKKVAPTQSTVLITGESGTGKEVVARAIHHFSQGAQRIFLPVNCAAIPENLLESQLFGHVRGAFTGAVTSQEGLFSRARGGTIFLDEIGDMPVGLQSKLLRAIETKEVLPVGSTQTVAVDVRIIAASNQLLREMVDEGRVREDLYYRLNVVHIELPPLPAPPPAPRRGHPEPGRVPGPPPQPRDEARLPRRRQRDAQAPHVPALEGQRPRARQRDRARDDPRQRRVDHDRRPAARAPRQRRGPSRGRRRAARGAARLRAHPHRERAQAHGPGQAEGGRPPRPLAVVALPEAE